MGIFKRKKKKKIICISWPKAGTHLLLEFAALVLNNKNGWYNEKALKAEIGDIKTVYNEIMEFENKYTSNFALKGHLEYTKEFEKKLIEKGYSIFFIIRDPRDIVCSTVRWISDLRQDWEIYPVFNAYSQDEKLEKVINGMPKIKPFVNDSSVLWDKPFVDRYSAITPWCFSNYSFTVKYEDLSGNNGIVSQEEVIKEMLIFIGEPSNKKDVKRIRESLVNPESRTFHTGKSGTWTNIFTDKTRADFLSSGGENLVSLFNYKPTQL